MADRPAELEIARPGRARRALFGALVLLLFVRVVALEPVRVVSTSMAPTLDEGDRVLVEKVSLRFVGPWRGELVVFPDPLTAGLSVKRVVAVAGDEVALEDGRLRVNGDFITEDYVDPATVDAVYFGPEWVPAGTVFVMGDNRRDSIDSRSYGAIRRADLTGRVVVHSWWFPIR